MTGILLEMKLTALPGNAGKRCLPCGLQASMVIADDQLHPMQASIL